MKELTEAHLAVLRRHMVDVIVIHAELAEDELAKPGWTRGCWRRCGGAAPPLRAVPAAPLAYQDTPLPIGFDKTISQPFWSRR